MATDKVVIPVELQAQLTGMGKVISNLQSELKGDKFKINLDSAAAKRFKGLTQDFEKEFKDFQSRIAGGEINLADEKDLQKQAKSLINIYQKVLNEFGNGSLSVDLAKQLFPSHFSQDLDKIKTQIKNSLKDLNANKETQGSLDELGKELIDLQAKQKALGNVKTKDDFQKQIDDETKSIKNATAALKEYYNAKQQQDEIVEAAKKEINQTTEARSERALRGSYGEKQKRRNEILNSMSLSNDEKTLLQSNSAQTVKRWQKGLLDAQDKLAKAKASGDASKIRNAEYLVGDYGKKVDIGIKYQEKEKEVGVARQAWENASQKLEQKVADRITKIVDALNSGDEAKVPESLKKMYDEGQANRNKRDTAKANLEEAKKGKAAAITDAAKTKELAEYEEKINKINESTKKLKESFKAISEEPIKKALKDAGLDELAQDFTLSEEGLNKLNEKLKTLDAQQAAKLSQELEKIVKECENGGQSVKAFKDILDQIGDSADGARQMAQEVANLSRQITQFFSVSNGIQLFKNAIRNAYEAVKELDAAMTETAVVTDFSVGDMWKKLPDYTKQANELGMTTVGLYDATTLFYQQGTLIFQLVEI